MQSMVAMEAPENAGERVEPVIVFSDSIACLLALSSYRRNVRAWPRGKVSWDIASSILNCRGVPASRKKHRVRG